MSGEPRFIVDHNVGKLTRYLRMMGYNAVFFTGAHDRQMVDIARREHRVILTRDAAILERRVVAKGPVRALLIQGDQPKQQIKQVITEFDLNPQLAPFSRCLDCNRPLVPRTPEEVEGLVPPYVFRTQTQYRACPGCGHIYWQGTHWRAMNDFISDTALGKDSDSASGTGTVKDSDCKSEPDTDI